MTHQHLGHPYARESLILFSLELSQRCCYAVMPQQVRGLKVF